MLGRLMCVALDFLLSMLMHVWACHAASPNGLDVIMQNVPIGMNLAGNEATTSNTAHLCVGMTI